MSGLRKQVLPDEPGSSINIIILIYNLSCLQQGVVGRRMYVIYINNANLSLHLLFVQLKMVDLQDGAGYLFIRKFCGKPGSFAPQV